MCTIEQVRHNIAVAEYYRDGCINPQKLLDVLVQVKGRSEELAQATEEQHDGHSPSTSTSPSLTGSGGNGAPAATTTSDVVAYMENYDSSIPTLNTVYVSPLCTCTMWSIFLPICMCVFYMRCGKYDEVQKATGMRMRAWNRICSALVKSINLTYILWVFLCLQAVMMYHLQQYADGMSVLEPLYRNIEPIDEVCSKLLWISCAFWQLHLCFPCGV
jgi:hypothetical protein